MSNELTVINQPLFPSEQELNTLKDMAGTFVKSGLLPSSVNTPEKAILIMLKGRELGLPPLQALSGLHVIEGKPGLSSETMLAMIYKQVPGAEIRFIRSDAKGCEIEAARPGKQNQKFSFTEQDAQRAGLLGKQNWQKYPQSMYRARCISAMARAVFPDAIQNCHTPEELENADSPAPGEQKAASITQALRPEPREVMAEVVSIQTTANSPVIMPKDDEPAFDPLGDYEVGIGDFRGKKLKDIPAPELAAGVLKVKKYFDDQKKPVTAKWLEFVTRAEQYLGEPAEENISFENYQ